MEFEKRVLSGREKDEASIRLLRKLRELLYSSDASNRRRAAYKLSWMQEDGLDILQAALFGNRPVPKMALDILQKGMKHHDTSTR